jgi:BirA family biotin operon repressor/biotin-[acetyl-CoA-carboxylase] ligase
MIKKIYKRLKSTNIKAQEILEKEAIMGQFWVQTDDQYQGRGLGSNSWISDAGKNITGSLVIYPDFLKADQQFELSVMASLAVRDLLNLFFDNVKIKWPNDILVNSNKIAGLLIEHSIIGDMIKHSIIGLGLNVNQEIFPDEIHDPISFKLLMPHEFDINEMTNLLLGCFDKRLMQLKNGHFDSLKQEYLQSLYRYKEFAPFKSNNLWFRARINGVDKFGQLILETETGEIKKFGFKEVEFID